MKRIMATVFFLGIIGSFACAQAAPSTQDFVKKASEAGKFEIESSQLALQKSKNPDVKAFAQKMIDDHTKANDDLDSALQASGSGAETSDSLNSKHAELMLSLQAKSGNDFDAKYISVQTDAHKDAVKLFTSYSKHGDNTALKQFAVQTLPTLQGHLDHVKELKSSQSSM